jgi:hypothetical protein
MALNAFERFVFVMSILEGQSDDECSTLLRCCSGRENLILVAYFLATTGEAV